MGISKQTSVMEQALFYYIKSFFPDAISRYKVGGQVETDIFLPEINVAIEYDGFYWHKNKRDKDAIKNTYLTEEGIYTIRVRDAELPDLPPFMGIIISLWTKQNHVQIPGMFPSDAIAAVINRLSVFETDKEKAQEMEKFTLSFEQYKNDYSEFLSAIYRSPVENNITESCAFKYWNQEKNRSLNPINVPKNSSHYVWIKCNDNLFKHVSIKDFFGQRYCENNCSDCITSICPKLSFCEDDCEYCNTIIENYINGTNNFSKVCLSQVLFHFYRSRKNIELIKKLLYGSLTQDVCKFRSIGVTIPRSPV